MADHPQTWPDLAIALFDRLRSRDAEITYEADNMEIWVPSGVGDDAVHAKWVVNGALKIRARDGVEA